MTPKKQPARKKTLPGRDSALSVKLKRPHRRNIPKANNRTAKIKRQHQIENVLRPVIGKSVANKHTGKKSHITKHSVQETAEHASKGYYSTIAAIDAPRQLSKAKPVKSEPADQTKSRIRQMNIKKQTISIAGKGKNKSKVVIGETGKKNSVLYCVTSYRDKPKKKKNQHTTDRS